jgi:hypothetical protein
MKCAYAGISLIALTFLSTPSFAQQKSLKDSLVGTWTVGSIYDEMEGGQKFSPWGDKAQGHYVFTADGGYTQILLGDANPSLKNDNPRQQDRPVVANMGRYTVDEAKKVVTIKTEAAGNSVRDNTEQTLTITMNGNDNATFVGSPRKGKEGTFTPHTEAVRMK